MTEAGSNPQTAGALLRAAREAQGLHIAALAAAIKVPPKKLDALEKDRWDELHDVTFARALAQTVCRTLKMDPRPVLDLLPNPAVGKLDNVAGTLNTPFRGSGSLDAGLMSTAVKPMVWGGVLLLLAALALFFIPQDLWNRVTGADPQTNGPVLVIPDATQNPPIELGGVAFADPAASGVVEPAPAASSALVEGLSADPAAVAPAAPAPSATGALSSAQAQTGTAAQPLAPSRAATPAPTASADSIQLAMVQSSWVDARDATGRVLISRVAQAGEQLVVDGQLPIKLTIGNAAGVELRFRQKAIDLPSLTRDNVARLQLP